MTCSVCKTQHPSTRRRLIFGKDGLVEVVCCDGCDNTPLQRQIEAGRKK